MTAAPLSKIPSRPRAQDASVLRGDRWRVTVLTDGLLRLEWSEDGAFEDRASSFALHRDLPTPQFTVRESDDVLEVSTDRFHLLYDRREFSANGLVVTVPAGGRWRFGERRADNLGGTARTLDDADGRIPLEDGVAARDGIAVIDDSASFLFDDEGWVAPREPGRRDLYVFAYGHDYGEAVAALYALSGRPPVLPRWALGNWWSRYHAYTADAYLELFDRFDAEQLPFSVAVIDMDWHRVDSVPPRYGTGWTGYSWERRLIPDPEAFLGELHRRGLWTTLNLHPADGVRPFEDAYPEVARAVGVDPASDATIPFDLTDRAFLDAYFRLLHHPLEDQGVDFWWIDWQQGSTSRIPDVDPLWLLNHFHFLDSGREGRRPMAFSRYAGPGSQRYGVGFSGDAVVSWESLAFQPEFTASAANIGYSWWSHDIGGHTRGIRDDELATRWLQLGVFSPVLRLHSASNPFIRKEPWQFPAEPRQAMGEALRLRHRLVPYLHTMNHVAATGTPLVRPMYHVEPERDEAYGVPNQFAFGSELVVAPITTPRDPVTLLSATSAWLPPGTWTDIFTGTVYDGDRHIELHRGLDGVPALLRGGGILPLAGPDDLDATRNPEHLELLVAPSDSGTFTLIEDDGQGDGTNLRTVTTALEWDAASGVLRIGPAEGPEDLGGTVPATRTWTVTFFADLPTGPALVDGEPVEITGEAGRFSVTVEAATASGTRIELKLAPPLVADRTIDHVRRILGAAQFDNPTKLEMWRIVTSPGPLTSKLSALHALRVPTDLLGAVVEQLTARQG
ncbi:glycoside hydrolase [Streptomyces sp. SID8379]|uniref:glycoside hydrolase family 31 protein n=1 Tax=unclassified Streptomyces TaxID=2593676 RepID=UPI000381BE7D|nr:MULTISPECIES: glycoside hydrolase family 31 protein [unclassified Streptomyces]MYW63119.1 glycoside hydrolase [Streptomyces sp. SID8379]